VSSPPPILILDRPITRQELESRVRAHFSDMVKFVVDLGRGKMAVGGELHADAEEVLLEDGSSQQDLWGANYYPGHGADGCIEYTSLINIRPSRGNRSMEVEDEAVRTRVRELTFHLLGRGEEEGWPRNMDP
jgi:hypothetical protein